MADLENGNGSETPLDEPSRKVQLIEVAVFLFLIVPSMAVSFFAVGQADLRFMQVAISSILNDLALLSLVLYFIWRNRESIRQVGWNFDYLRGHSAVDPDRVARLWRQPDRKCSASSRLFCAIETAGFLPSKRPHEVDRRLPHRNRCGSRGRDYFSRLSDSSLQGSHGSNQRGCAFVIVRFLLGTWI